MPTRAKRAGPKTRRAPATVKLVKDYRQKMAIGRRYYQQAGDLLDELLDKVQPGDLIALGDGLFGRVKDLFGDTNKAFKVQAVPRYELEIVDAAGKVVRLRDRRTKAKKKTAKKKAQKDKRLF